jgi:hypothetical protein
VLDWLWIVQIFSKIDLRGAYNLVQINVEKLMENHFSNALWSFQV